MKPKHQRLIFVTVSMVFLCAAMLLTMQAFKKNLVYFYSPADIAATPPEPGKKIRVGGLVKAGTIKIIKQTILFTITDGENDIFVIYHGMLPNLFREGQGVVAEGVMADSVHFDATTVLAKHDEKYIPKEVVDSLKKSGRWKGE